MSDTRTSLFIAIDQKNILEINDDVVMFVWSKKNMGWDHGSYLGNFYRDHGQS